MIEFEWGAALPTGRRNHAWVRDPETGRRLCVCANVGDGVERWTAPLVADAPARGTCERRISGAADLGDALGRRLAAAYPRTISRTDLLARFPPLRSVSIWRAVVPPLVASGEVGTYHHGVYVQRYYARSALRAQYGVPPLVAG